MNPIQVIAFDADDTLWVNEPFFQETERKLCALLEDYLPHHTVSQELFKTQIQNLPLYGYGVKSFILSMIETSLEVSEKTISLEVIAKIIDGFVVEFEFMTFEFALDDFFSLFRNFFPLFLEAVFNFWFRLGGDDVIQPIFFGVLFFTGKRGCQIRRRHVDATTGGRS